jgi:hypothetical protein
MNAENVQINRVENGWVVTVWCAGSTLLLVAKSIEEVSGFIKGMDWTTPRPLYEGGGVAGIADVARQQQVNPAPAALR